VHCLKTLTKISVTTLALCPIEEQIRSSG